MATTRPRTAGLGAVRRQSMRAYNEPFTPNVEEREENEAYILRLELPDFGLQHVKVKVEEEARMVVVTGDRLVANNRLLILDKAYPIPKLCIIDQILHKLEDGFLTITMPKQATALAVDTAAPPPLPPKELEQTTSEKKSDQISPANIALPPKEPEQTTPEKGLEKISPEISAPPTVKTEQTTPEKEIEKISPENAASPAAKTEITEELEEEEDKGKSKKVEESTPTPTPEVAPPPTGTERDSGKTKITPDEIISSPNPKPIEKKEIGNENPVKGKESKAEEVGKNEETAKIGTGASPPRATGIAKLGRGLRVHRVPLPATVSLAAAVAITVVAYLAFAYYGLLFAMERI